MASNPEGSGPPIQAYSPRSKSVFGRVTPKNVSASWMVTSSLMPIAMSCCAKIWLLSTRDALFVVSKRNSVFPLPHVHTFVLLLLGDEGPPVQPCDLSSLIAFFGLKLYLLKYAYLPEAFVPISYSGLFSGLR